MNSIVVHYQEIALKGRNRPYFVTRFVHNLRVATAGLGVREVRALMGRVELVLDEGASYEQVGERIARVFGGANFAKAGHAPHDVEAIAASILADLGDRQPSSFRVSVKRADKRFPMKSPEIEREVGGRIKMAKGWRVDLDHPELTIYVEMVTRDAFYFFGKDRGPGGLPTGVSGRVTCLLSGGIDSPVAAWRMMKRGCQVDLVHFHSHPFVSRASQEKVREIAELLTGWQLESRLFLGTLRPVAAGDRARRSRRAPRRPVPADDAPHRRSHRQGAARRSARDGRGHRPGRLADARESVGHRRGDFSAHPQTPGGDGQGGDRRPGRAHRDLRDLDRARPGLLPVVHAQASGHQVAHGRRRGGRTAAARRRHGVESLYRPRKSSGIGSRRRPPPLRRQAQERLQYARFTIVRCISQLPKVLP